MPLVALGEYQPIHALCRRTGISLGYVGGPACVELEVAGEETKIDAALGALVTVLGSDVRDRVTATAVSRWAGEPYIRGAYAAVIPGEAERRSDLARPLADRVFFAGEATSPEFFSTLHGAWETGVAATRAIARKKNVRGEGSG